MGTFSAKAQEVRRGWYVVDATDCTLGRLASAIAFRLRGKHKAVFTPHVDTGDYIVVINASRIKATGNKRTTTLGKMMEEHPERALTKAVKGMLPKNSLGATMLKKLRVYGGGDHEHSAQQPLPLKL
jgi:large subunit ribosomal protein L13